MDELLDPPGRGPRQGVHQLGQNEHPLDAENAVRLFGNKGKKAQTEISGTGSYCHESTNARVVHSCGSHLQQLFVAKTFASVLDHQQKPIHKGRHCTCEGTLACQRDRYTQEIFLDGHRNLRSARERHQGERREAPAGLSDHSIS